MRPCDLVPSELIETLFERPIPADVLARGEVVRVPVYWEPWMKESRRGRGGYDPGP